MNTQDFSTTLLVEQTPAEVFNAINNVRAWWFGEIEGSTDKLNDEFTYKYETFHYTKQKLTEVIPNKKIVWLVTESNLSFVEDKNEWTGTKIIFDITEKDNKTEVRFTHQGLVPKSECYNECSNAWSGIVRNNLYKLITKKEKAEKFISI
ncbi:MAG TPA: SRPBCC domain-containing protein [Parafilimonas sp.]|nr:SRPBCC domain-containing protein [Parafilimonas sp.]